MINPQFTAALLAAMRLQQGLVEAATAGRVSEANAIVSFDQMRANVAIVAAFLDDLEQRMAADPRTPWSAR